MIKRYLKIVILILLPLLLLQGCWLPSHLTPPANVPAQPELFEPPEPEEPEPEEQPTPGQFTLRYEPQFTMNPIRALNRDNIMLTSL